MEMLTPELPVEEVLEPEVELPKPDCRKSCWSVEDACCAPARLPVCSDWPNWLKRVWMAVCWLELWLESWLAVPW